MSRLLGTLLALAIAPILAGCGGESHRSTTAADERAMAKLERIVRQRVDSKRSTGIVAGVVFPDGSTRIVANGDAGEGRRVDASSVFEIGSITKVFTATLLADMVQRGEVKLTDPVARFLPAGVHVPERGGRQISLVDLATHTSGLPRLPTGFEPKDPANPYADYSVRQLYEFLSGYTLTRDVGSKYEYSNLGVGLLGHVLAVRAGTSYEQLLRERILEPLEMTTTGITLAPETARHLASGHDARGKVVPHWDIPTLAGAGAIRSTVTDMLKFASANLGGDGRVERVLAATHAPRRTIGPRMRIGLGWHILRPFGRDVVWHDGGTGGFSSFIGLDTSRHRAIVVLSNSSASSVDDIGLHFLDERVPLAPSPTVRTEIRLPRATLERYVGAYQLPGLKVGITLGPKGLVAKAEGQPPARIYAASETEFFLKVVDAQITFLPGPGGAVTGLVLHQGGLDTRARKLR